MICTAPNCGSIDTRPYVQGARCAGHTPAREAGRPEVVADPERALEAVAAKAGRPVQPLGPLPITPKEGVVIALGASSGRATASNVSRGSAKRPTLGLI